MIEISQVCKTFRRREAVVEALRDFNLTIHQREIVAVIGPSGCGKSTLLNMIAGIYPPSKGQILYKGTRVSDLNTDVGYMTQKDNLLPWRSVRDNIAFPLELAGMARSDRDDQAEKIIKAVGLDGFQTRFPNELSGGMRKRAGFARAMVLNPDIVFFDEPDSGLDPVRTSLLNDLILQMHAEHGGTYLLVTHDIRTARKVSDYVGLIWKGKVVHYGDAEGAFNSPDPFVRQFLAGDSAGPLGMD